jgi:hypothetical protein
MAEAAPTPRQGETPQAYILRVCEYLSEPHRRRLGEGTAGFVAQAVSAIEGDTPTPDTLNAVLRIAAEQRIEDMVDYDALNDALATADDVASRIRDVLGNAKMWWTP